MTLTFDQSTTPAEYAPLIRFHTDAAMVELLLTGTEFLDTSAVNLFFDTLEETIMETGENRWFLLCDVSNFYPEGAIWVTFARRMHTFSRAYSMGAARIDPTRADRLGAVKGITEFDEAIPLFLDRASAVDHIGTLPNTRSEIFLDAEALAAIKRDMRGRMRFLPAQATFVMDFRDLQLLNVPALHASVDIIEELLRLTGRKWYFLIQLAGTVIAPEVWPHYATRGRDLNLEFSLGTVRVSPDDAVAEGIEDRAESQGFDPNLVATVEEGMAQIARLHDAAKP